LAPKRVLTTNTIQYNLKIKGVKKKNLEKMTSWSNIQSGFNVDDETINFGTRIIAENNGSLYEACTVATIQSHEKVCVTYSNLSSMTVAR